MRPVGDPLGAVLGATGLRLDGPGRPLEPGLRKEMEQRFGQDFSAVRLHTDPAAAEAAGAFRARAFTVGRDVVVGAGEDDPASAAGRRLLAHELAHVVEQTAGGVGRPLLVQRLPVRPEEPDPFDPFKELLKRETREAMGRPPPPAPPIPTIPGDPAQQAEVFSISGSELFDRPDVKARMEQLAEQVEASEAKRRPGKVRHTKLDMLNYWDERFRTSVEHILTERPMQKDPVVPKKSVSTQMRFRKDLELEEAKLVKSTPGEALVAQVDALRARLQKAWTDKVDQAVQRFVTLAEQEAELLMAEQRPQPARVLGLPEGLEPTVTPEQAPGQLERGAKPVAASVIRFWKAVQEESGTKAVAENYTGHELANPKFTDRSVGKYSFDVHPSVAEDPQTGFYNRVELIKFFKAVEKASERTGIEWMAFYNDAAVIKEFNAFVNKGRIAFSGGGGGGKYHHGPAPYILHVHFNIMPKDLAAKHLVGVVLGKAQEAFETFLAQMGARF